jgi:hypothetical protein
MDELRKWLRDLADYLVAAIRHWGVLVTGGVVLGILEFIGPRFLKPGPLGALVQGWAVLAIVYAGFCAWRDERTALVAARAASTAGQPSSLRRVVFDLSREIREWLKSVPEGAGEHDVASAFNARFWGRVLEIWPRIEIARFPKHLGPIDHYLAKGRDTISELAGDLEILVRDIPPDFLA